MFLVFIASGQWVAFCKDWLVRLLDLVENVAATFFSYLFSQRPFPYNQLFAPFYTGVSKEFAGIPKFL